MGIITASFRAILAYSKPAISSHFILGFSSTMASDKAFLNLSYSSLAPPWPYPLPPPEPYYYTMGYWVYPPPCNLAFNSSYSFYLLSYNYFN